MYLMNNANVILFDKLMEYNSRHETKVTEMTRQQGSDHVVTVERIDL